MTRWGKSALLFGCAGILVFALSWLLIDPHLERSDAYPGGMVLRDSEGQVLRVSLGAGDVDCRPYYQASREDWIVKALVASEDRRFFDHHGVNLPSVLRACFQNVTSLRRISGASTLTMQATRLILPHPRTLLWKYVEAFRALKMECRRDKLWIITQYLNRAPFGSNLVGVEAAANGWFGKSAKELGIGEAALLAGMVQSPTRFRPDRHLEAAMRRREYVLKRMLDLGAVTPAQYEGARKVKPEIRRSPRPFREPFFCDWVARRLVRQGCRGGDVVTTLDADIQRRTLHAVEKAAEKGYSSAAVVMRAQTAEVVALACSGNYFSTKAGQVNTALSPRPAGSTLKPFLTAFAMDRGLVTPEERLADVPKAYRGYNPSNFDASHRGLVKTSDALVLSLNLPFVQLLQRVGVPRFGTLLRSLGCLNLKSDDASFGLGLAIGNAEVSLLELVGAYGGLARGGTWLEPTPFKASEEKGMRIFSEGACWLVSDILSGEQRTSAALGHVADVRTSRFAWKTGTSSAYRDAWTVAWNPEYVVGVWCGHKEGGFGDTTVVGALAAAPFAWELARGLYPADDGPWYAKPNEVVTRTLCSVSGLPAAPECPLTEVGRALAGRSSSALCDLHRTGIDGTAQVNEDAFVAAFKGRTPVLRKLAISKPEDQSVFRLVPGLDQQRIVCKVVGTTENERLWWFVDGRSVGETRGSQVFAWAPSLGTHRISCSTADGLSASVTVNVLSSER